MQMRPVPRFLTGLAIATAISLPIIKSAFYPTYYPRFKPNKKTHIVTGATGNLGSCIAAKLAHFDQRVIMACRDMDKCRALRREIVYRTRNNAVVCRHLDLSSVESINNFASEIIKTEPRIDVLINNAAIKELPEKTLTKEGIEMTFFVNYIGPFLLTLRLLDKLVESSKITKDSRIINVIGKPNKNWTIDMEDINFDKRKYKPQSAYQQSKLALAYFTQLLEELVVKNKHDIFIYGINPGWKKIADASLRAVDMKSRLNLYYQEWTRANPDHTVGSTLKCALDADVGNRGSSGYLYGFYSTGWSWKKPANDIVAAKILWNKTASILLDE